MPKGEALRKFVKAQPQIDTDPDDKCDRPPREGLMERFVARLLKQGISTARKSTPLDNYVLVYCLLLLGAFSIGLFIGTVLAVVMVPHIAFLPGGAFLMTLRMFYKIAIVILG